MFSQAFEYFSILKNILRDLKNKNIKIRENSPRKEGRTPLCKNRLFGLRESRRLPEDCCGFLKMKICSVVLMMESGEDLVDITVCSGRPKIMPFLMAW